jgi:hypothetical protein
MRTLVLAAAILIAGAGAGHAIAQPTRHAPAPTPAPTAPPQPPPTPPKAFADAGYSQPDITPGYCKTINATEAACSIPAMTAGAYLVTAEGTSTATAEGAAQRLVIVAGDQSCAVTRTSDAKAPWPVGSPRSVKGGCYITIVSDTPVNIAVVYADEKATKDAKGPVLAVRRAPWPGVLSAVNVPLKQ